MKIVIFLVLIVVVLGLLAALPAINIDKDAVLSSSAWDWVMAAFYFIPVHTVVSILTVIVGLGVFRILIALVKTIWDLLPVA